MPEFAALTDTTRSPAVRGFLHLPASSTRAALVLTHGAGSDCDAPLLVALAKTFAERGVATLRCDLPYRQLRPKGPPRSSAAEDQAGLRSAVDVMRKRFAAPAFMGGVSYGGRMATMLGASAPELSDGLLVLSYPLHAPGKPQRLRIAHLPKIRKPALFVSGDKDAFGSPEELRGAIAQIAAKTSYISVEGAGHDLGFGRKARTQDAALPARIVSAFEELFFESETSFFK